MCYLLNELDNIFRSMPYSKTMADLTGEKMDTFRLDPYPKRPPRPESSPQTQLFLFQQK